MYVYVCSHRKQKRLSNPLDLELRVAASHHVVLETELRSSATAASAPKALGLLSRLQIFIIVNKIFLLTFENFLDFSFPISCVFPLE